MAKIIDSPMEYQDSPSGFKGSPGVYNGEDVAPFNSHKRSGGGIPEKTYDQMPGKGDSGLAFNPKIPKNLD